MKLLNFRTPDLEEFAFDTFVGGALAAMSRLKPLLRKESNIMGSKKYPIRFYNLLIYRDEIRSSELIIAVRNKFLCDATYYINGFSTW